jgi:two-component system, NarL family, sensor histidine kinase DesK
MSSRARRRTVPDHPYVGYRTLAARVAGHVFTGIWLLYLVAPLVDLYTHPYSEAYRWGCLAIVVVFAAIYMFAVPNWSSSPRYALPAVAALAGLAVIASVLYGGVGASGLWIYVSSAAGLLVLNRGWALRTVLACGVCYTIFSLTGHVDKGDLLLNLLPTVLVGLGMIGLRRQFQLTAELARAREEVAQLAASEERLRLARDLHDLTGQSLSMITLKSELAAKLLRRLPDGGDRDRALAEAQEVAAVSRQTLHDIREAISGYRRPTLAVEIITARTALESAGITTHDDPEVTLLSGTFDPDVEATLAWCLREAATNVLRHSGARNCHVSLTRQAGSLCLEVRDDGPGPNANANASAGPETGPDADAASDAGAGSARQSGGRPARAARSGTGLRGMSERVSALGGHLEVRPSPRGFRLLASVPEEIAGGEAADSRERPGQPARAGRARRACQPPAPSRNDQPIRRADSADNTGAEALPWPGEHDPGLDRRGPGDDPRGTRRAALLRGGHRGGGPSWPW